MMLSRNLAPSMTKHGLRTVQAVGLFIGAVAMILALGLIGANAGIQPASSLAAENGDVQQQRVELIRELRAENLADFNAMERAPDVYTHPESASANQLHRVATIVELREQNLADFDAMEQSPGLYT